MKAVIGFIVLILLASQAAGMTFGTEGNDDIEDMIVLPDGNFVAIVEWNEEDVIICFHPDDGIQWIKPYGIEGRPEDITNMGEDVLLVGTGGAVARLEGSTGNLVWGYLADGATYICADLAPDGETAYLWGLSAAGPTVMRIDTNGQALWSTSIDIPIQYAADVVATTDGGCITVSGYSNQPYIAKISGDGELAWLRGDIEAATHWSVSAGCSDGEGGAIIVGNATELEGDELDDPLAMRIDGDGNVLWLNIFDHDINRYVMLEDVARLPNGNFIAVGFHTSYVGAAWSPLNVNIDPQAQIRAGVVIIDPEGNTSTFHHPLPVQGASSFRTVTTNPIAAAGWWRDGLWEDYDILLEIFED